MALGLGLVDPDDTVLILLPSILLVVLLAPITLVVLPLVVFGVESVARAVRALLSSTRWVEAVHAGPAPSRMSWQTDAGHVASVVDQVARQLELGYERVQPHRARFLGF